jgi:hypothetical protein
MTVPVTAATLTIAGQGFTVATQADAGTNLPIHVPVNTSTITNGFSATITLQPTTWTVSATSGQATLTPSNLSLHVVVPYTCYPPGFTVTIPTITTPTTITVTGASTEPAIDSVSATP